MPEGSTDCRELDGSVAIVTGGAGGIGRTVARALAVDGAVVVIADIDSAGAEREAERLRADGLAAEAIALDVARPESATAMAQDVIARHGRIDILINNAALDAPPGLAWEIDEDHWNQVIGVNLSGQWWCTRAVLPHMMERRAGRIIFMSSVSARIGDIDITIAYSAAKAGLIGLTVALSVHLQQHGIRVNAIAPGATGSTGTPMTEHQRLDAEAGPFGLMGPEPVADACLYLARRTGDHITGTVMNVSSGMWRG